MPTCILYTIWKVLSQWQCHSSLYRTSGSHRAQNVFYRSAVNQVIFLRYWVNKIISGDEITSVNEIYVSVQKIIGIEFRDLLEAHNKVKGIVHT